MHPILIQFKSFTIYTYGFFLALAMVASFLLADWRARREHLLPSVAADLIFFLFVFGVIGARAFFVLQHFHEYQGNLWAAFSIKAGGLVWYGGFITAGLAGLAYASFRKWPVLRLCDFFAPILPFAHAIGRLGCFFNGCCFGRVTDPPWGVIFAGQSERRFPIQLVESALLFILSFFLFHLSLKKGRRDTPARDGEIFVLYLFFYSALRFVLEFFRGDQTSVFYLTLPQWVSLVLFLAACLFLFVMKQSRRGNYSG